MRSSLTLSGITTLRRYPLTWAIIASPMPVLPLVGSSRIVSEPGPILPARSASSISDRAIRSLTLPDGLFPSSLAKSRTPALRAEALQLDERRVPDRLDDVGESHGC